MKLQIQMFSNTQKASFYKVGTKHPQKAIMVKHPYKIHGWGAFQSKVSSVLFTGIMDGAFYREILTENLFNYYGRGV
jgi:hypothetical protein